MLRKYLCLLLSLTLFCENSSLLASPRKKTIKDYKEGIYKIFSPVEHLKYNEDKRAYLERVLYEINKKLNDEKTSHLTDKDLESFNKIKSQFQQWEANLAQVEDEDLDRYAKLIIQQTEQAFVVELIVASVLLVIIIAVVIAYRVHIRAGGGVTVVRGPRWRWGVRRRPLLGPRRGPGFHVHCHARGGRRGRC